MTITPTDELLQEWKWRLADRRATALEHALAKATFDALNKKREPPSAEDQERAKQLRETADRLFELAVADIVARAKNRKQ